MGARPTPGPSREREGRKFGEAAARLGGAAGVLLGWRAGEFWDSTPAELAAVLQPLAPDAPDEVTIDELRRRFPDE